MTRMDMFLHDHTRAKLLVDCYSGVIVIIVAGIIIIIIIIHLYNYSPLEVRAKCWPLNIRSALVPSLGITGFLHFGLKVLLLRPGAVIELRRLREETENRHNSSSRYILLIILLYVLSCLRTRRVSSSAHARLNAVHNLTLLRMHRPCVAQVSHAPL